MRRTVAAHMHRMHLVRLGEDGDVVALHLHKPPEHERAGARQAKSVSVRCDAGDGPSRFESNDKVLQQCTNDIPC